MAACEHVRGPHDVRHIAGWGSKMLELVKQVRKADFTDAREKAFALRGCSVDV